MRPDPTAVEPGAIEGPAFPWLIKGLASFLVAALVLWGLRVARQFTVDSWFTTVNVFVVLALMMIGYCYYWILVSRTRIDAQSIRQSWLWPKQVAIASIVQARFIFVPYMSWLIAPRLVVRVQGRGMYVFHAADRTVLQAFARLSLGQGYQ
jgi:ABC-type transport system involved in Fe-S cluster assembly fused permease/ATPase subunit